MTAGIAENGEGGGGRTKNPNKPGNRKYTIVNCPVFLIKSTA